MTAEEILRYEVYRDGMKVGTLVNAFNETKDESKQWVVDEEGYPKIPVKDHIRYYETMDRALQSFKPGRFSLFGKTISEN